MFADKDSQKLFSLTLRGREGEREREREGERDGEMEGGRAGGGGGGWEEGKEKEELSCGTTSESNDM